MSVKLALSPGLLMHVMRFQKLGNTCNCCHRGESRCVERANWDMGTAIFRA